MENNIGNDIEYESIESIIFDMDGTLYEFTDNGSGRGFDNSVLDSRVCALAKTLIGSLTDEDADVVLQKGIADEIGISNYLNNTYGLERDEYFATAWNVDPEGAVTKLPELSERLRSFSNGEKNIDLTLLTAAPKIWQQNVFKYLDIEDVFGSIYSGDMFETKRDVFKKIADRTGPATVLSIGDQLETDVLPARELGMYAIQVASPSDTLRVIDRLSIQ